MTPERARQETASGNGRAHGIIAFPPPDYAVSDADEHSRCLWCGDEFTPLKPNQVYCKPKHSQYACERRKAALVTAVAALLAEHGASPSTARTKAADVVEAHYRPARPGTDGRVTRAMKALGWKYDEAAREWKRAAS